MSIARLVRQPEQYTSNHGIPARNGRSDRRRPPLSPNTAGASMDVAIKRIRNEIKKKMAEIDARPRRG
jgi:hypothetical protein